MHLTAVGHEADITNHFFLTGVSAAHTETSLKRENLSDRLALKTLRV
jgi:hypothetical protein